MSAQTLLRFSTAGSVDDGKSTLIGRLLFDSRSVLEDQVANLARTTERRGGKGLDLALLTDGLAAEREQGITIDVAYRYFATKKRKFIIADTPGHEQYTRNMVTGASTADLTIVLIDAKKGVQPQSRRHAAVASLLGIPHLVVAVNKMDAVGYSQERFEAIRAEFSAVIAKLDFANVHFVPVSALEGDMTVARGKNLPWYHGPALLELLEQVEVKKSTGAPLRFPVQYVAMPGMPGTFHRGYMGRIESGGIKKGDRVLVQPCGLSSTVHDIVTFEGSRECAQAPQSVTLVLADEIDISRGDLITHPETPAQPVRTLDVVLCWMDAAPLQRGGKYLIKHTTNTVKAVVERLDYRLDITTLERDTSATQLALNDIGAARLKLQRPLIVDDYAHVRATGGFIIIDEVTNHTVGAGMVVPSPAGSP
jgi:sulfate adenylyltransferase large subunit